MHNLLVQDSVLLLLEMCHIAPCMNPYHGLFFIFFFSFPRRAVFNCCIHHSNGHDFYDMIRKYSGQCFTAVAIVIYGVFSVKVN